MAHVRKDTLAKTGQWWKHLRPYWKRRQQRRERVASAKLIRAEFAEQDRAQEKLTVDYPDSRIVAVNTIR